MTRGPSSGPARRWQMVTSPRSAYSTPSSPIGRSALGGAEAVGFGRCGVGVAAVGRRAVVVELAWGVEDLRAHLGLDGVPLRAPAVGRRLGPGPALLGGRGDG